MKWYRWIVFGLALFAAHALFTLRFIPTHDGEYHIIRFWQFDNQIREGNIFPRWAPDLNSGYGVPLFIFHYPFPNYIGSVLHAFGFTYVDSFKLALAIGYLFAVYCCYILLARFYDQFAASVGTILFSFVPYWFVDIYVRGSIGEVWAIAWVMLALAAVAHGWKRIFALAVALIVLSHNITALFTLPMLLLYLVFINKDFLAWFGLGLGISAYFWMPALIEQTYMVGLSSVNIRDHFPDMFQLLIPSWGTGFSGPGMRYDEMSYQIGVVPLLLVGMSLILLIKNKLREKILGSSVAFFFLVLFMMTAASYAVWHAVPLIAYIQYPWRLLTFVILLTAFIGANIVRYIPRWMSIGICILAVVVTLGYIGPVTYERREDTHYLTDPNFTDGTSSLGNSFTTIWTPWKNVRRDVRFVLENGGRVQKISERAGTEYTLVTNANEDTMLDAGILYYPGWRAYIDQKSVEIAYETDGTLHIPVPDGRHTITLRFEETPLRALADTVSVVSLFSLLGWGILRRIYARSAQSLTTSFRSQSTRRGRVHQRASRRP